MARPFIALDIVGLGFAGAGLVWAIAAAFFFAPPFAGMFADFSCCLPTLTELWLFAPFDLALGIVPFAVVLLPWALRARRAFRAVALGGAVLWVLSQPVVFFVVMYLPIVELAKGIQ